MVAAREREPNVIVLRPGTGLFAELEDAADQALAAVHRHLERCKLAERTVTAYRRQTRAYVAWLIERADAHPDAFADVVGAEAAVTAWRRHLIENRASPSTINQSMTSGVTRGDFVGGGGYIRFTVRITMGQERGSDEQQQAQLASTSTRAGSPADHRPPRLWSG